MIFEIAGFLLGGTGIGVAFWRLYMRDSSRLVEAIYARPGGRQRA